MSYADDFFKNAEAAPIFGRGEYLSEGKYRLRLDKIFPKDTFKGVRVIVVECTVVANYNDGEENQKQHPVGAKRTWMPKFAQPNTMGNMKQLMFAAMGLDAQDVPAGDPRHRLAAALSAAFIDSKDAIKALKDEFQIGEGGRVPSAAALILGREVDVKCTQTQRKDGGEYTRHDFAPPRAA